MRHLTGNAQYIRLITIGFTIALFGLSFVADSADLLVDRYDDAPGASTCDILTLQDCSLRGAIIKANAGSGSDTIILQGGTYTLTAAGAGEDWAAQGDLDIRENLTITSIGGGSTIDAAGIDRVFEVFAPSGSLEGLHLSNLVITGGNSSSGGGCISTRTNGHLFLDGVTVRECSAATTGGGIDNNGYLEMNVSTLEHNLAGDGGGLYNHDSRWAFLDDSTVGPLNSANGSGGGIWNDGHLVLDRSTVEYNTCISGATYHDGGGLANSAIGDVMAKHSTFAFNSAPGGHGGAIFNEGVLSLRESTLSGNTAAYFDAVYHSAGSMTAYYTLFDGECQSNGNMTSSGGNLESPGNSLGLDHATDQVNVGDAMLGGYALNGGLTHCFDLLHGSPAIDSSDLACMSKDQRSFPRPVDGDGFNGAWCDVGSVEYVFSGIFFDGFESGDFSAWNAD